jgi:hypothetical protein
MKEKGVDVVFQLSPDSVTHIYIYIYIYFVVDCKHKAESRFFFSLLPSLPRTMCKFQLAA